MNYNSLYKAIVKAVKSREELDGVTCIYGNRREVSQNPVCGFTLAFEIGKTKYINKTDTSPRKSAAEAELCLLAPSGAGGKRLTEVAELIAQAVRESAVFEEYSEITVGTPSYNEAAAILSVDISVSYSREAVADPENRVIINGTVLQQLTSFSAEYKEHTEQQGELLNGYTTLSTPYYVITVCVGVFIDLPENGFDIRLKAMDRDEVYSGCSLCSFRRELDKYGAISYRYELSASELKEYGSVG